VCIFIHLLTLFFFQKQITGLRVSPIGPNKFQCECSNSAKRTRMSTLSFFLFFFLFFFFLFFVFYCLLVIYRFSLIFSFSFLGPFFPFSLSSQLTDILGVKFEVTIRGMDVEYTPLDVVGVMPECVRSEVFFSRDDWPIFLCKIIHSVFRP
jgi:hypothetical protein